MLTTKEILDRLKALRERMVLKQGQVARLLEIDRTTYVRKERGVIPITTDEWLKLATALDKDPSYFFSNSADQDAGQRRRGSLDELLTTLSDDEKEGLIELLAPMLDEQRRKRPARKPTLPKGR